MNEYKDMKVNNEVLKVLPKRERQIIEALPYVDIKPSLTQIAKRTGMSISTAFYIWKKLHKKFDIKIELIPK